MKAQEALPKQSGGEVGNKADSVLQTEKSLGRRWGAAERVVHGEQHGVVGL